MPTELPKEVKEAVERFLWRERRIYHSGCMGGWDEITEMYQQDIQAGIVLAKYLTDGELTVVGSVQLQSLREAAAELQALHEGGVSHWEYYGQCLKEVSDVGEE